MRSKYYNKNGFYVYSYYQAREVILVCKKFKKMPYIVFNYYLLNNLGINWIKEIRKLLYKEFDKKEFQIILDCQKNPALAIMCISYGFFFLKFEGNKILIKNIKTIKNRYSLKINHKITIIDLKKIKNCNKYISRIMNQYRKKL